MCLPLLTEDPPDRQIASPITKTIMVTIIDQDTKIRQGTMAQGPPVIGITSTFDDMP